MADTTSVPDLPTIKKLAQKHGVDFRTLRRFFEGGNVPRVMRAADACKAAGREWIRAEHAKARRSR